MTRHKPADRIGARRDVAWYLISAADADKLAAMQNSVEVRAGLEEYARECRKIAAQMGADSDTLAG